MKAERILSVIFAILAPLPLIITSAASDNGGLELSKLAFYAAIGAAMWLLGWLMGLPVKAVPEKMRALMKVLSIAAATIIVVLCEWLLIVLENNTVTMILVPLAIIFCYWFGFRLCSDRELLPFSAIWIYCVETALTYPMCRAFEEHNSIGSTAIFIMAAAMTVMGAVIVNVRHLEQLSWQGGGTELNLVKATVRFNLKKTLTFSAILLFMFFFAGYGAKLLWEGVKALVRWLLDLLETLGSLVDVEPIDLQFPHPEVLEENDNWLWQILSVLIIAAILIIFMKPLLRHLKRLIQYIKERLSAKPDNTGTLEASYVDTYEESERWSPSRNTFRKAYRAFAREKDPTKKYRLGYKAFMLLLGRKDENTPSDTTAVHLVRGRVYDDILAENVIGKYERLRYHEFVPTKEDCQELDKLLKAVKGH